MVLSMTGLASQPAKAAPPMGPSRQELMARCLNVDDARSVNARGSEILSFVGTASGRPIPQPQALTPNPLPEQAARAYLNACSGLFGIQDPSIDLITQKSTELEDGRSTVRFQQTYLGVPVLGGEMVVQMDQQKNIQALVNKTIPTRPANIAPAIDADTARRAALQMVAKIHQLDESTLTTTVPELWIYDPALLNSADNGPTVLVWRLDVSASHAPVDELVLVDAQHGYVVLNFNQVETVMAGGNPAAPSQAVETVIWQTEGVVPTAPVSVYTMNQSDNDSSLPGTLVCNENNPSSCNSDADAQNAYQFAVATFNYYYTMHSRNSIDGAGMRIVSSVHYGSGYPNAYWSGSQIVFGDYFPTAEDVVGHELTHGVTQYESNLFYYYQSGAINESLSDLWGEFVEQTTTGDYNDWLLGEDLPSNIIPNGAVRNMADPSALGDPDRMSSSNYYLGSDDYGGVHRNSGINNKAAYLMTAGTAGGTFNGQTIAGLGQTKVAKIYYEAQTNLLVSGSDYNDLYNALYQACLNLVGKNGIIGNDCIQVRNATLAVEMNQQPETDFNPDAPVCDGGEDPVNVFFDDLDGGLSNFTMGYTIGANKWGLLQNYAHSGTWSLWADDADTASDSYVRMANSVTLPAGAYLHFAHAYEFEGHENWDGGVVEYSMNDGLSWSDAGSLIDFNGYNGTIDSGWDNPLAGQSAFTGLSHGYISTRLDLSSLVGQKILFRWRQGTDSSGSGMGWFVDDIRLYTCHAVPPPSAPTNLTATASGGRQIDLSWSDNSDNETGFKVERSPAGAGTWSLLTIAVANAFSYPDTTVVCGTAYDYRVIATNTSGDSDPSDTVSATTWDCAIPAAPSDLVAAGTASNRIDLTWADNSDNETGFTIERSPARAATWSLIATTPANAFSYADTAVICGTAYDYRVLATNQDGVSDPSNIASATVLACATPNAPSNLVAVSSGMTQINLTWTDNSNNETGFKVERSPTGANTWSLVITTAANVHSYIDATAKCGKAYDYLVTALNINVYSRPSNISSATTQSCLPIAFSKSKPVNNAPYQLNRLTLSWGSSPNATSYEYCIHPRSSTTNNDACITTWISVGMATSKTISSLIPGATYYWQVRARNINGTTEANGGTWWSFFVSNLPGVFSKTSPANATTNQPTNPTLKWGASMTAANYEYCIDTVNNNACDSNWISTGTATSKALTGLAPGMYYWQVRTKKIAIVTYANGSSASWWSFSIASLPAAFNKTSPSNGNASQPVAAILKWAASSRALSYEYCIDTVNNNACDATWVSTGIATSKSFNYLAPRTYYWQVRARNNTGITYANSSSTAWRSFTVIPPLINGDFEGGSVYWTIFSAHGWRVVTTIFPGSVKPHSGTYAAWLGGFYDDISFIQQKVTVSTKFPYLVYWHWIASADICGYDFAGVRVNDSLEDVYDLCYDSNTGGWVQHSIYLGAYAGQTVTLQIRVETDSTLNSNLFIDDISFRSSAPSSLLPDGFSPIIDNRDAQSNDNPISQGMTPQGYSEKRIWSPNNPDAKP